MLDLWWFSLKDEILSYLEMCGREGMSLQRGMNFRSPPAHGIILMSRRPNAPYEDEMSSDETVLLYEGHDVSKTKDTPDPKAHDQQRHNANGKPTENGKFADSVDNVKQRNAAPAIFRVYEKMLPGIWTDRGLYLLRDYGYLEKRDATSLQVQTGTSQS